MSIYTSLLTAGTNSHQETSENANAVATDFVSSGVIGAITNTGGVAPATGAYAVNANGTPNMTVIVSSGIGYVTATPNSQNSQTLRVRNTASITVNISANASGSTRYDYIYIQIDPTKAANPAVDASDVASIVVSRSSSNTTDNGTPPAYGLLIAVVTVANGASSITNGNINDRRVLAAVGSSGTSTAAGWNPLGYVPTYSANNGQKEFVLNTPSDLSSFLYPGMKFKFDRTVAPPTQSMAFTAASSQYATKASPSGITFTGAFTCEAWIYLNSYTGQNQYIVSRTDTTTGGFQFYVNATGQLLVAYGASSVFTSFQTYQSIPLNRWVHVAGVVTSVASKTGAIYINGALAQTSSPASSATTLAQTSNLSVGAAGAGVANTFLNGYLSEVRVWATNQSQANVQANMAISLTGAETNLVALFQGNGNFNDKTSNANNLTATNGAIATQAANPYRSTEYGLVTNVTSTQITLFMGTDYTVPSSGGIQNVYYSTARAPAGFPTARTKWLVDYLSKNDAIQANPVSGTWYNLGSAQLPIPTGEWRFRYNVPLGLAVSPAGRTDAYVTLSTANNTESDNYFTTANFGGSANTFQGGNVALDRALSATALTTYYLNSKAGQAGGTNLYNFGSSVTTPTRMEAECAYI